MNKALWVNTLLVMFACHAGAHPAIELRIEQLTGMIEQAPQAAPLYLLRGSAHSSHNDPDKALADFHTAIMLGANREGALALARHFYRTGSPAVALIQLDLYNELGGESKSALLVRARVQVELGATNEAVTAYRQYFLQVKGVHPGDVVTAARLVAQSRGGQRAALALLDSLPPRLQHSVVVVRHAVEVHRQLNEHAAALQRWQLLENQMRQSADWQAHNAALAMAAGNAALARLALAEASRLMSEKRNTPAVTALRNELAALQMQLDAIPADGA